MIQISVPKKYNMEQLFYSGEKDFQRSVSGKYFYKNFEDYSPELIESLKKKFKQPLFSFLLAEKGGQENDYTKTYVQIICDYSGDKILPILKTKGIRANKEQAFFKGQNLCSIEIYFYKNSFMLRIIQHYIDKKDGIYSENILYEGKLKNRFNMSKNLKRFNDAIDAALEKIKDSQCTRIYYSL